MEQLKEIEVIADEGKELCYIISGSYTPDRTEFVTPSSFKQQVGFVVYPAGGEVARHVHVSLERNLVGTSEVLLVRSGRCHLDVYAEDKRFVASREILAGDVVLMVAGGHGLRMIEDTVLLEVKQGPYTGMDEKERF